MEQIRYKQRNCTDEKKIENFLLSSRIGVVGMNSDNSPYAVPVNFVWHEGSIYFHGMGSGKKVDILSKNPPVCFTIFEEQGTVTDPVPCHADTAYMSIMIFGKAEKVTDAQETMDVLQKILDKYMPGFYKQSLNSKFIEKHRSSHDGNAALVYRVTPKEITAKENVAENDKIFTLNK